MRVEVGRVAATGECRLKMAVRLPLRVDIA